MATIHFFDLEDFARELTIDAIVRVEGVHKGTASDTTPALFTASAEVHVRAVRYGDLLVWCYHVGETQVIRGQESKGKSEGEQTLAVKLERVKGWVVKYLESVGLPVLPGLIDITPAVPVRGTLAGFDAWVKDHVKGAGDAQDT